MAYNKLERILLWISSISILVVVVACGIFMHWAISFLAAVLLISVYLTQFGSVDFKFMKKDDSLEHKRNAERDVERSVD